MQVHGENQVQTNKHTFYRVHLPCWHVFGNPYIVPIQFLMKGEYMNVDIQITTPAAIQSVLLSCTRAKCYFLYELGEQLAGYAFSLLAQQLSPLPAMQQELVAMLYTEPW